MVAHDKSVHGGAHAWRSQYISDFLDNRMVEMNFSTEIEHLENLFTKKKNLLIQVMIWETGTKPS